MKKIERIMAEGGRFSPPWDISREELAACAGGIGARFRSLSPATVAFAGLVDGINPCVFTTLVFFISYLVMLKKRRREILLVGVSFTLAVFLTYFLIGIGALNLLSRVSSYRIISQTMIMLVALLAVVLGIVSFIDYLRARRNRFKEIGLQLPGTIKSMIHNVIRTRMHTSGHMLAAFTAGVLISGLELVCTGQVYLPTITFILSRDELKSAGTMYLLLYNVMFVLPLIAIFMLAYRGVSSDRLAHIARRNIATVKLGTAVFFMAIGLFLLFNAGG